MRTLTRSSLALSFCGLLAMGCDGSGKAGSDGSVSSVGLGDSPYGVVLGPLDHHCGTADGGQHVQSVGVCKVDTASSIPANSSTCGVKFSQDGGAPRDAGAATGPQFGGPMYGSSADDDDCKYYISWVSTPIQENADTYFTMTAIRLADGKPASCAQVRPEVYLSATHPAAPPRDPASEIAPGVYKVGPIRFDAPGNTPGHYWTIRFHLYEECNDTADDSPHGHAAFYLSVP